jgi:hypothetical protein
LKNLWLKTFLAQLNPTPDLFAVTRTMFRDAWDQQYGHTCTILKAAKQKITTIEQQMEQFARPHLQCLRANGDP